MAEYNIRTRYNTTRTSALVINSYAHDLILILYFAINHIIKWRQS